MTAKSARPEELRMSSAAFDAMMRGALLAPPAKKAAAKRRPKKHKAAVRK
jgi:hypothetical protein